MSKDFEVRIYIDGIGGTSSVISVENGLVNSSAAEEEFFALLRKSEKAMLKEAEEEEKSEVVDSLTQEQEEKLKEAHAKDYIGTDDDVPDAYDDWLLDLPLGDMKKILV